MEMAALAGIPCPLLVGLDIETTGLNVSEEDIEKCDEILEVSTVVYRLSNFEKLEEATWLIRPSRLSKIKKRTVQINGITKEAVADKPEFHEVASKIYDALHGNIWFGHNIKSFDQRALATAFKREGMEAPQPALVIDTTQVFPQHFQALSNRKLATYMDYFGLGRQSHRALDDVNDLFEVFQRIASLKFLAQIIPADLPGVSLPEVATPPPRADKVKSRSKKPAAASSAADDRASSSAADRATSAAASPRSTAGTSSVADVKGTTAAVPSPSKAGKLKRSPLSSSKQGTIIESIRAGADGVAVWRKGAMSADVQAESAGAARALIEDGAPSRGQRGVRSSGAGPSSAAIDMQELQTQFADRLTLGGAEAVGEPGLPANEEPPGGGRSNDQGLLRLFGGLRLVHSERQRELLSEEEPQWTLVVDGAKSVWKLPGQLVGAVITAPPFAYSREERESTFRALPPSVARLSVRLPPAAVDQVRRLARQVEANRAPEHQRSQWQCPVFHQTTTALDTVRLKVPLCVASSSALARSPTLFTTEIPGLADRLLPFFPSLQDLAVALPVGSTVNVKVMFETYCIPGQRSGLCLLAEEIQLVGLEDAY